MKAFGGMYIHVNLEDLIVMIVLESRMESEDEFWSYAWMRNYSSVLCCYMSVFVLLSSQTSFFAVAPITYYHFVRSLLLKVS